jgi:hypothetical protein
MEPMTPDKVRKMVACASLLPPPGDEVVKELGAAYLALHKDLREGLHAPG